jgi:hypothetical protein
LPATFTHEFALRSTHVESLALKNWSIGTSQPALRNSSLDTVCVRSGSSHTSRKASRFNPVVRSCAYLLPAFSHSTPNDKR